MCTCKVILAVFSVLLPSVGGIDLGHPQTTFSLLRSELRSDRQLQLTYSSDTLQRRMLLQLVQNRIGFPDSLMSERWRNDEVRERRLLADETSCLFTGVVTQEEKKPARAAFHVCNGMVSP
ncbi:uncharacterized protein LOC134185801 [Corticium candelabrum]|uniref:uncharacterized protein LOC134185801 n=1 Tax=Corticium candelabrum TaxID=121492 RepID=UPI002E26A702|nr:uncharacterized protein LOC134185801 [Corticium candelabrum]